MQVNLTNLTGAVNMLVNQLKGMEDRLRRVERGDSQNLLNEMNRRLEILESPNRPLDNVAQEVLQSPRNEEELKEIQRLPDSVKELRTFDGNPVQYVGWVHSVETVLKDFDIVRTKPIYRAIMLSIRQKVIGAADTALISYNVFENNWHEIKKVLSLHYADKRDVQTLEHQLSQLSQGSSKVDEFYAAVNHQLSLIVNKIKTETYSQETISALIEAHRNRALDVFIRGLKGTLSQMLIIQKPRTLPEAYSACLDLQNLTMRNTILHTGSPNSITVPVGLKTSSNSQAPPRPAKPVQHYFNRFNAHRGNHWLNRNQRPYRHMSDQAPNPPPRTPALKYEPMDIDRSRQVNYMNRPGSDNKKRGSDSYPRSKQPRLFHLDTEQPTQEAEETTFDEAIDEVNFMGSSRQAFLT